jgi:hypothetical protein
MGHFAGLNIRIFEIKGSEDSRHARSQNLMWDMCKVMAQGHVEQWIGAVARAESTRLGLIISSMRFRGTGLDLEESLMSPGTFMGVKIHPDPN